jgi:hypothetical protein
MAGGRSEGVNSPIIDQGDKMKLKLPGILKYNLPIFGRAGGTAIFVAVSILLVLSFLGTAAAAFLIPGQRTVSTAQVKYEQTGQFDYIASLKPSYLFGPEPSPSPTPAPTPTPTPLSNLKYPVADVERFNFNFSYEMTSEQDLKKVTEYVEVFSNGTNSDSKKFDTVIMPKSKASGPFTVNFELIPDTQYSGGDITLTINVYPAMETGQGLIAFESYTQTLKINLKKSIWEVERAGLQQTTAGNLGEILYKQSGKLDYTVKLKSTSAYGGITLDIPSIPSPIPTPTPTAPEPRIVGPGTVLFSKLVDQLDFSFKYKFVADQPVSNLKEELSIVATLENPDVWSKTFVLVPAVQISNNSETDFALDLNEYYTLLDNIRVETGVPAEAYKLTIKPVVQVSAQTQYGDINEVFSPTLSTSMGKGVIEWTEKLEQNKAGQIASEQIIPNSDRYLGLSVSGIRTLSLILMLALLILFALFALLYWRARPQAVSYIQKESQKIKKKYADRIIESVPEENNIQAGAINLLTMDDLVKLADELNKPILHYSDGVEAKTHYYFLYEEEKRYQYVLNAGFFNSPKES